MVAIMGLLTADDNDIEILQRLFNSDKNAEARRLFAEIAHRRQNEPAVLHRLAILAYQAGQLHAAGQLLDRVTQLAPTCPAYWNDLGVILLAAGFYDRAIQACRRAIELQADYVEGHYNLGNALSGAGRLNEAIDAYHKVLSLRRDHGGTLNNLGNALRAIGRNTEAIDCLRKAIELQPDDALPLNNLGVALHATNQESEAVDCYRKAIALKADYAEAHNNLGNVLRERGDLDGAIEAHQRALVIRPTYAQAHSNLGLAFRSAGRKREGLTSFQRAVELDPRYFAGHNNLGLALEHEGRIQEALDSYRRALRIDPRATGVQLNLGRLLGEMGSLDEGIAICREVINDFPGLAEARHNLSILLLFRGEFEEGWREYEWRLECPSVSNAPNFPQPRWRGDALVGRTILLHAEQGFGDAIQFSRYVPRVAALGGKVIAAVHAPLFEWMRHLPGASQVVRIGDPLPQFDVHCPLMSLPLVLGCPLPIPPVCPHGFEWEPTPRPSKRPLRIGLCWAGRPLPHDRSINLRELRPLADLDATFESLQVGPAAAQIHEQKGWTVVDHSSELRHFADTAALIRKLDLVITVDTAVAHLAGTIGVPTFLLLTSLTDWRWMHQRRDTLWYPSIRLFRQLRHGDWSTPIARVKIELAAMAAGPS